MPGSKPGDLVRFGDERKGLEVVSASILKEGLHLSGLPERLIMQTTGNSAPLGATVCHGGVNYRRRGMMEGQCGGEQPTDLL
jgi:hypothetical protein